MLSKDDLLRTALLGTEQQQLPKLSSTAALDTALKAISSRSVERGKELTLLDASALLFAYEKAGFRAQRLSANLPEPAKEECRKAVGEAAVVQLKILLETRQDLLPEWLRLLQQTGKRVPHECLVQMLEIGHKNKQLRAAIRSVGGERAAFLARLNPDWAYITSESEKSNADEEELKKLWDFGQREERLEALKQARLKNPGFGLSLLSSTWKDDSAEDRLKFLSVLPTTMQQSDEPFLEETVLEDKRKEIRRAAQDMLTLLPESRFANRAEARLFEALSLIEEPNKTGFLNRLFPKQQMQLSVNAPEQCDKAMLRDGLNPKSPDSRLGERAWLLCQMIGQVNPTKLFEHLALSQEQFLSLLSGNQWQLAIYHGLEEAALRFKDQNLAQALLEIEFEVSEIPKSVGLQDSRKSMAIIPAAKQEELLSKLFEKNRFLMVRQVERYNDSQVLNLLMVMEEPWSPEFSKLVLKSVRTHMTQKNNYIFMDYIMRHIGNHMDTDIWAQVQDSWANCGNYDAALQKMIAALSLRQEMKESLKAE